MLPALPGYETLAEVGRGSAARVLRVRRIADGRVYAGKLRTERAADPVAGVAELCREAAVLAGVNHPGIVAVHEVGVCDRRPFLVMDYIDGHTLAQALTEGPFTPGRTVALALDVADALGAIHRAGLVHRDLKPDNIMIDGADRARLIDFGLATRQAQTDTDAVVGTLMHAAPEQAGTLNRPVDQRSDLYSLGVVLFECVAGRPPFVSSDVGELLHAHAVAPVPDLIALAPGTPPKLATVITRLLAKEPDDRYQTCPDLIADLRGIGPEWVTAARPGPTTSAGPPMLGRWTETAQLTERWEVARQGTGCVCVVRGGAGTGKTRLVRSLTERLAGEGAATLFGTAAGDGHVPMAPLRDAMDAFLADVGGRPDADEMYARVRSSAGEGAPLLATLSPDLSGVLGDPPHVEDDGTNRFPVAVATFLGNLARANDGLLLVLDDAHRADEATRRVVEHLASELGTAPILLVLCARDDDVAGLPELADVARTDLAVPPLADDDVSALVGALLPGALPADPLTRHLISRSRGIPLVVHEYLRAVIDAGLLRPSWGRWELNEPGLDALQLPQDALGLMLTRIRDLSPDGVDVLATAGLAGTTFRPDVVATALGRPGQAVLAVLAEATDRGLVEPTSGAGYTFLHSGIRDALAATLDASTAARRHRALADALAALPSPADGRPPEHVYAIAQHYLAAGSAASAQEIVPACGAAGLLALRNHAPARAAMFLGHAVALNEQVWLLQPYAAALRQLGRLGEAAGYYERAVELEPGPLRRAELMAQLAEVYWGGFRVSEGGAMARRGLAELGIRLRGGAFVTALGSLLMFVAALVIQWTRIGFGTVRGPARKRAELAVSLHEMAGLLAGTEARAGWLMLHFLRTTYWGNRLGRGGQYVSGQYALAVIASVIGSRRAAASAYARMTGENIEPKTWARIVTGRTLLAYINGDGTYDDAAEALEEQSKWLDIGSFSQTAYSLVLDAVARGRNQDASRLWALSQRRLASATGEKSALGAVPAVVAAAHGRHAEAARQLARFDADLEGVNGAAIHYYRYGGRLVALWEQQETGAPFDEAVAGFQESQVNPIMIIGLHRVTLYHIASGRVAQLRRARVAGGGHGHTARLAQARKAVAVVGRGARDDTSRSYFTLAKADLAVAAGRAGRALRILDRDTAIHRPDAPLIAFERARIRARALIALDDQAGARRYARMALTIAEEESWSHRAGWIIAEFPAAGGNRRTVSISGSTMAGSSTSGWSDDRRRLRALEHLGAASSRVLEPEELARVALDEIIRLLHAERAFLFLVGADEDLRPHLGRDADGTDLAELTGYSTSLVERVRLSREPLVMTGTEEGAALGAQSVVLHGLRSLMISPLLLDDRLLGVVYLDSTVAKGIFTAADSGILNALASHIAVALETARAAQLEISEQAARRQRDLADRLRTAFEAMSDTLDPATVLDRLLHWTSVIVPGTVANLVLRREHGPSLRFLDHAGAPVEQPLTADPRLAALMAVERPTLDPDVPADLMYPPPGGPGRAVLPLRTRSTDLGVLVLASAGPEHRLDDVDTPAALVAQGMAAFDNASLFARIQELAAQDELTGVPNRRRFFELAERELATAARLGRPAVAMMLDIDHFKQVNDGYGHPTGDDVIREVARRLTTLLRDTDVLGRYGGEEFAVIATDADGEHGFQLAERLRMQVAGTPVATRTGPVPVTVSIGVAEVTVDAGGVADSLALADRALYRAKQEGRNRTCHAAEQVADHR